MGSIFPNPLCLSLLPFCVFMLAEQNKNMEVVKSVRGSLYKKKSFIDGKMQFSNKILNPAMELATETNCWIFCHRWDSATNLEISLPPGNGYAEMAGTDNMQVDVGIFIPSPTMTEFSLLMATESHSLTTSIFIEKFCTSDFLSLFLPHF